MPRRSASATDTAAPKAGGDWRASLAPNAWLSASAAPARNAAASSPAINAGNSPTLDRTEKRPPRPGSWSSARSLRDAASRRSGFRPGSVMTTARWAFAAPSQSRQAKNWVRVSAVPPDLEMAINPVLAGFNPPNRSLKLAGSILSMKWRRGPWRGRASAASVWPPRLEPPVPSTITSLKRRNSLARRFNAFRSSRLDGNAKNGVLPARASAASRASAGSRAPARIRARPRSGPGCQPPRPDNPL